MINLIWSIIYCNLAFIDGLDSGEITISHGCLPPCPPLPKKKETEKTGRILGVPVELLFFLVKVLVEIVQLYNK